MADVAETYSEQRLALLDRIAALIAESRGLTLTPELRKDLRDALEVSYRTIYQNADDARRRAPRDPIEVLLAQLYRFDAHKGH